MKKIATESKARRRWYQFHLWHLFVLVLIAAIPCSWFGARMAKARRQREVVAEVEKLNGLVFYDYQSNTDGVRDVGDRAPGPAWLRNLVGVDFMADVVDVSFDGTQLTDAGLERIKDMRRLETLELTGTEITDAGLEHLKGLPNLRQLWLADTRVTKEGVKHLQQALPNCNIEY
jgi:hypothetical protein